jgi:hypothetical protein
MSARSMARWDPRVLSGFCARRSESGCMNGLATPCAA